MYQSTSCIQHIEDLSINKQMDTVQIELLHNLQNKVNTLQQENIHLQAIITNISTQKQHTTPQPTKPKLKPQPTPQPSPISDDISLQELLAKLDTIDVNDQIDRINNIYSQSLNWKYSLNINDNFILNKTKNNKTLILTAFVSKHSHQERKYGINVMRYAYDTKFVYSHLHQNESILILDTFDYISYLNISTNFEIITPTNDIYEQWNNMLTPYFSESINEPSLIDIDHNWNKKYYDSEDGDYKKPENRYDCTHLLNRFWYRKKRYASDGKYWMRKNKERENEKYYFKYSQKTTSHFNKILSILYWSKYFNYILWMDDDAFFGNFNVSINYYFNLIPKHINNDIFMILPFDHNQALVFSNFAFMINATSTNNDRFNNFLYLWFKARAFGFQFYDQDAMNYALLQYLTEYDLRFMKYLNDYYLYQHPFKYTLFFKCIEYCKICPVDHMCMDNCLRSIHLKRCPIYKLLQLDEYFVTKNNKRKKKKIDGCLMMYNTSLLWTPWVDTIMSDRNDDYKMYPFVFQHNYDAHYRYLNNKTYRDPDLKYLKKIYDNTFIIHKRYMGKWSSEHAPFLYGYTTSNTRKFVVDYLKNNDLMKFINDSDQYPTIHFQDKFSPNQALVAYQKLKPSFSSYFKYKLQ